MFDHLIVGIDGRDGGRDAVALARALRPRRRTLAHVYTLDAAPPFLTTDFLSIAQREAERTVEAQREELGLADADTIAAGDRSPARALHRIATEREADLLVVGSAHRGPVARVLLGDVGRGVLADAPCAVAVAPHGSRDGDPALRRIAVGYDDEPEARAALEVARDAAADLGAALTLVAVWDIPATAIPEAAYVIGDPQLAEALRDAAQERLDRGVERAGGGARGVLERGQPGNVLEAISEEQDLLVVGSRGWGPVRRVMLGSTSDRLVHHAACPVIVVPRPEGADEARGAGDADEEVAA